METSQAHYQELLEDLPSLMQANIEDDLDFEPQENIEEYCQRILYEIEYERSENYEVYSKEEMDKLEATVHRVLKKLGD